MADHHPTESLDTDNFAIEGLLCLLDIVLSNIELQILENRRVFFRMDDRTPAGPGEG